MAYDLSKNAGQGVDEMEKSESMPLLKIIQDMSAEVKVSHPDHEVKRIEGLKAGDIMFLGDRSKIESPLVVIPVAQDTVYVEWKPKKEGGGIVGQHDASILTHPNYKKGEGANKYKEFLGSNDLKKTIYTLLRFQRGEEWELGLIAFSGGSLKKVRAWNTAIANFKYPDAMKLDFAPPMFARKYEISTFIDSNDSDDTYYNWAIKPIEGGILDPKKDEAILTLCDETYSSRQGALPDNSQPTAPVAQIVDDEAPF